MPRSLPSLSAVLAACCIVACGGAQKTGDETRSGATEIRPGLTFDDKVAASKDPSDWKRFRVDSTVQAVVVVHWDNPSVKGRVSLKDQFGATLAEARQKGGTPSVSLPETRLQEGTYFVEVAASKGSSVYTLEVRLGGPSSFGVPRPE